MVLGNDFASAVLDARFRIEAMIGEGRAGGHVYRAVDTRDGAPVAIRTLPAERASQFAPQAATLARVSEAAADAERLIGYGTMNGTPWLAFEWLEGQSLEAHLAEGGGATRSLGEALTILEPAARALGQAHAIGAFHGDVRPANLWLAKADGRTRMKLTQFSLGAPSFAPTHGAPEHFKSSYGPVGPATDVFGLALTLVEIVSGRPALAGADDGELYLFTSDMKKRPTLRSRGVATSDAIEAVLQRALAVDPKRRYADSRSFWDALVAAIPELTPAPPSVRPGAPAPLAVVGPSDSRGLYAWIAVALVVAAAAAIVGAKVFSRSTKPPVPIVVIARPTPEEPSVKVKPFLTDMVRVPEGSFVMGTDHDGKGDGPAHRVRLTKAFTVDRLEVTAEAYEACIEEGHCTKRSVHGADAVPSNFGCSTATEQPKHPANCVDRMQAEQYCAFVGKRLPTEAEWEYAARGADARDYPWGKDAPTTCATAVVSSVSGPCAERKGPLAVGSAPDGRGPFGTLDMAGNVWEWVADGFEPYAARESVDPKIAIPTSGKGVLRGGSWDYAPTSAKTTYRLPWPVSAGNVSIGFRCAEDAVD
jgi:formylglycine-generating enzyme required for sulfatase activity